MALRGANPPRADALPVASAPATPPRLRECPDCGLLQLIPSLPPAARVLCLRCDATLRHTARSRFELPLALYLTALILLVISAAMTLLAVSNAGRERTATLFTGPVGLEQQGLWVLGAVVLFTTFAAPLARVLAMITVLTGLWMERPPSLVRTLFAWDERLRPWSMIEVYLLGVFVAYVRLTVMVHLEIGASLYALGALMLVMVAADYALDRQAVWEAMEVRRVGRRVRDRAAGALGATLHRMGCDTCGLVSRAHEGAACPRCGFALHDRKPDSITRTWAFGIAALILYVPANTYPVLTVVRLGAGQTSTILGGAQELLDLGEWPLALLVFFASIAVPVLKLAGLAILLLTTQAGRNTGLHDRTVLYRIVDAIGRWSMIDVFMISILVALVQFGAVASVHPGVGAIAFASVVVLTMFASHSFDPRLMWDAARR
jgi:paraquat-inducible protein A